MDPFLLIVFIFFALLTVTFVVIESFAKPSIKHLIFGVVAVILGLTMGALLSNPISKLPGVYGEYLPIAVSVVFGIGSLLIYNKISHNVDSFIEATSKTLKLQGVIDQLTQIQLKPEGTLPMVVIDSSVLIDKRVVEIARTGFLSYKVIVPRFVLKEIQNIADSKDGDRRDKGRRGLEAVEELKKIKGRDLEISSETLTDIPEVDHKLVALSKKLGASLMTTDYNLNKIAQTENVKVLNVNELAHGLRPNLLPGEELTIKVVHLGKDKSQGVGYLEDGTMIVVESGNKLVDKKVKVRVTRSLQTAAGKMYFAKIING